MTLLLAAAALFVALMLQKYVSRLNRDAVTASFDVATCLLEPETPFEVVFRFENRTRRPVSFFRFALPLPRGFSVPGAESSSGRTGAALEGRSYLMPRQALEKRVTAVTPGRGRYVLHGFTVYGGDFLGLSESWRDYSGYVELIVCPREARIGDIDRIFGGYLGDMSVRRFLFEDPVLTSGLREYTGREPMKQIAWAASARRGQMMVREYDHTTEPGVSVILSVDGAGEHIDALIERAFELARAVCHQLEKKGAKYDFITNARVTGRQKDGAYLPEGLGERHYQGVLETMGRAMAEAACPVEAPLQRRDGRNEARGAVLIAPRRNEQSRRAAERLRREGARVMTLFAEDEPDPR